MVWDREKYERFGIDWEFDVEEDLCVVSATGGSSFKEFCGGKQRSYIVLMVKWSNGLLAIKENEFRISH